MKSRKYFKECECDTLHYNLYEPPAIKIGDTLGNVGITPNVVTIFRLILIFIITFLLFLVDRNKKIGDTINNKWLLLISVVLFIFAVILDDVDGYIARKFKMCSKIGAFLDVFSDFVGTLSLLWICSKLININLFVIIVATLIILSIHKGLKTYYRSLNICEPTILHVGTNINVIIVILMIYGTFKSFGRYSNDFSKKNF